MISFGLETMWRDMKRKDSIDCVPFFNFDQLLRAVADSQFDLIITHIHSEDRRDVHADDFSHAKSSVLAVTHGGDSGREGDVKRAETEFVHRLCIPFGLRELLRVLRVSGLVSAVEATNIRFLGP